MRFNLGAYLQVAIVGRVSLSQELSQDGLVQLTLRLMLPSCSISLLPTVYLDNQYCKYAERNRTKRADEQYGAVEVASSFSQG